MQVLDYVFSLVFSAALFPLAFAMRRICGSWASPSALLCAFWGVFSLVPLVFLYWVPMNPLAMGFVFFFCFAFCVPFYFINWRAAAIKNRFLAPYRRDYLNNKFIRIVFRVSAILSVVFLVLDWGAQGFRLAEFFTDFFVSSNRYMELRYEGAVNVNAFGQWGLIFAYLAVIFGGLVFSADMGAARKRATLILAFIPSIVVLLAQSAKGLFFISIALFLAAIVLARVVSDKVPHVDTSTLPRMAKFLPLVAALIVVSLLSRGLYSIEDSAAVVERLLEYFRSYAFLHLFAFSDWFSHYTGGVSRNVYADLPLQGGFFTFIALFRLVGVDRPVDAGVYTEYFSYDGVNPGNIYTIFRGFILDFGIVGALIIALLAGALAAWLYRRLLTALYPSVVLGLYIAFVQILYTSYIISALIWNATYLVTALVAMLFVANNLAWRGRTRGLRR
jgi:oligosaccharide repeat unit polymerase